jgi:hypothetical protein
MAADITSLKKTFGTPVTGLMSPPFIAPAMPPWFGKVAKGKQPKVGTLGTALTGLTPPPFIASTQGLIPWFGKVAKGKLPKGSKVIAEKKTKKQTKKSSKSVTIQKVFLSFSSDTVHYSIKFV